MRAVEHWLWLRCQAQWLRPDATTWSAGSNLRCSGPPTVLPRPRRRSERQRAGRRAIRITPPVQQFSSRGTAMQLGRTWTALIVVQVAFAVAALPGTIFKAAGLLRMGTLPPAAAAAGLLGGTLHMSSDSGTTSDGPFAERMTTLIHRMQRAAGRFRCHVRRRDSGSRRARGHRNSWPAWPSCGSASRGGSWASSAA